MIGRTDHRIVLLPLILLICVYYRPSASAFVNGVVRTTPNMFQHKLSVVLRRGSSWIRLIRNSSSGGVYDHRRIIVVGGGLAGLSVVYHLLCQVVTAEHSCLHISVQDTSDGPGKGGASAVAGG